jgi:hypothetical protein
MFKSKEVLQAEFYRGRDSSSIEVQFKDNKGTISLFENNIAYYTRKLGEIEIEEVVTILSRDKKAMLKQCNFPAIYDKMLSDLIEVQRVRYGVEKDKKRKQDYIVTIDKLDEILSEYYKIKDAHVYSIDVGSDQTHAERIDLESVYRYLILSFREGDEEDE